MSAPQRYGITFPFDGIPLLEQRDLVRELVDLGYTDLWSAESGGYDAFIPLAVAAQWAPELRLGTAIVRAWRDDENEPLTELEGDVTPR